MALFLWNQLQLHRYWAANLPPSREGKHWLNILKIPAIKHWRAKISRIRKLIADV